jgi:maleylacetoacetate isomerase
VNDIVLYTYWRSSSAYRVRLGLALKGLAYRSVFVNLLKAEQRSEAHVARSPLGFVPCLEVDGRSFIESVAILELLDDLAPERPLLPRDPYDRARVRGLVEIINAGTQPLQNLAVLQHLSSDPEVRKEWTRHWIARGLAAFEAQMAHHEAGGVKGPFAYGAAPTMADCFLLPMVYNARRYHVDMTPLARIEAACAAFAATEAAKAAAPEAQPDAVPGAP